MLDHWADNGPPVYMAAAAYLGLIKKKGKRSSGKSGDLDELERMFAGTGGIIQ